MSKKQFKIVKIIDESTFIVNAGSTEVNVDDLLRVIGGKTVPIKDPDSDNIIEKLPTYKTYLTVKTVYDKVCICKTEWIEEYNTNNFIKSEDLVPGLNMLKEMVEGTKIPGHYEEVPINEEQIDEFNNHDNSPISLGDRVEIVSPKN
ncbi:MAG: hypothetical protein LKI22_03430 [Liquorilactobacillus nagelii]|jgi:hypothetical protein|uniref:hypothetical protein n=1 Tax=Liquorilactobacillus nagelii TaxID=82688 RepID=UPI00242AB437|nr:hypothetical protein [Liquorilactobacillus nagelii]MCI1632990.1 hypothetical protein [Liquorilactobacillus nagelii]